MILMWRLIYKFPAQVGEGGSGNSQGSDGSLALSACKAAYFGEEMGVSAHQYLWRLKVCCEREQEQSGSYLKE